ncbi:MAG: hypothetical protein AAF228_03170 [Pseudomonadota bacterium]
MHQQNAIPSTQTGLIHTLLSDLYVSFFSNWRLMLLGLTGLVLSLASGWTTFDGINNFTKSSVLSFMITFGIQGVMLVTAWLIGESFAIGLSKNNGGGRDKVAATSVPSVAYVFRKSGQLVFTILVLLLSAFILAKFALDYDIADMQYAFSEGAHIGISILGAILAFAVFVVLFSSFEIIGAYARGLRIILGHLPLWLMFLSCMATSVFFSFDSLFNTIFPENERARAGELRVQRQIGGMLADIEVRLEKKYAEMSAALLKSPVWGNYEKQLKNLEGLAQKAPAEIDAQSLRLLEQQRASLSQHEQSLSEARARKQNLVIEHDQLVGSLKRLEVEKTKVQQQVFQLEAKQRTLLRALANDKAAAKAEVKGVGASGREGRGPKYRQLQKKVVKSQIEIDALTVQITSARQALEVLNQRRQFERPQLLQIKREISAFEVQETSAEQTIALRQDSRVDGQKLKDSIEQDLKTLVQDLSVFRQEPKLELLTQAQNACGRLVRALHSIGTLKPDLLGINCTPKTISQPLGALFTLKKGRERFRSVCGQDAKVPSGRIDTLLDFGSRCIVMSALPSSETQNFRETLSRVALNRDDKSHRFVVTWNAFSDGNRLAYLTLAIAIAIDCLVFMSGLFGANAVASPLSESPKAGARPVAKLEKILENALLPDKAYAAELALNIMDPRFDQKNSGFIAVMNLEGLDVQQSFTIKKVLTAGASLGFIKHEDEKPHVFHVRSELFEYLSSVRADEAKRGRNAGYAAMPKYNQPQDGQHETYFSKIEASSSEKIEANTVKPVPLIERPDLTGVAAFEQVTEQSIQPSEIKAQKSLQKTAHLPAPVLVSQHDIDDVVDHNGRIHQAYLQVLGLTSAEFETISSGDMRNDLEEWQTRLHYIQRHKTELSNRIDDIKNSHKNILCETRENLRNTAKQDQEQRDLIEQHFDDFFRHLTDIAIWKAYRQSKKRYKDLVEYINVFQDHIQIADEVKKREINDLISKLEEAEQNNLEGWIELEDSIRDLTLVLVQLKRGDDDVRSI